MRASMPDNLPLDPLGHSLGGFCSLAADRGFGPGQAERAYKEILREGRTEAFAGGGRLVARARIAPIVREMSEEVPEGTTTKFVQRLDDMPRPADTGRAIDEHHLGVLRGNGRVDHLDIESVIIPMIGRTGTRTHTLCVSSQIGCAMGCGFCETAQMGLVRSLTAEEIVGQWWAARHIKGAGSGIGIDNIVFMGMGEPLDNAREVIRAIEVLTDRNGPGIAMSRITISTVGRVDGLRLLDEKVREHGWHRLGLAVSVNAPNDEVRDGLMPINKKYDMAELRDALMNFRRGVNRKLCFEYVLIPGVNDTREHARQLAAYLEPFKATEGRSATGLVNVIPYNPRRDSPWPAPEEEDVTAFIHWLGDEGLYVKRRRTKGRRMMGACGQLGTAEIRGRKLVGVTIGGSAAEEAAC